MKSGALLTSPARGEVVVEARLFARWRKSHPAGAGLDSFEQEPPAPMVRCSSSPTRSSHRMRRALDAKRAVSVMAARNVLDALDGKPLEASLSRALNGCTFNNDGETHERHRRYPICARGTARLCQGPVYVRHGLEEDKAEAVAL